MLDEHLEHEREKKKARAESASRPSTHETPRMWKTIVKKKSVKRNNRCVP